MSDASSSSRQLSNALSLRVIDEQVRNFRTEDPTVSLGTDPSCTIRLSGADIDPVQCLIVRGNDRTLIRNMADNSLLNEKPFSDEVLEEGDVIRIADITIEVLSSSLEQLKPAAAQPSAVQPPSESQPAAAPVAPAVPVAAAPAAAAPVAPVAPVAPAANLEEDPFEALKRMSGLAAVRPTHPNPKPREVPVRDEPTNEDGSVDVNSVLAKMDVPGEAAMPAASQPVPSQPVPPAKPAVKPSKPEVESDSSIDDYMKQLLERNGIDASNMPVDASSGKVEAPAKVEEQPVPEPQPKPEPKKPRKRVKAPERQSDLSTLRELANQSNRTAITRHARSTRNQKTLSSFLGGIACALCGLIMLVLSHFEHVVFMAVGFGMIGLAAFLMLKAVKAGVFTKVGFRSGKGGVPHSRRRSSK